MTIRSLFPILTIGLTTLAASAGAGEEFTLIVNQDEESASYYISLPADEMEPILATDPDLLFSDDGRVPISEFRLVGSFDLADDIFANITGSQGDRAIVFEAMSMMVHPTSTPLPFAAPWDAYTAISVCSVDYGSEELVPGVLQMYYGGFTDEISGSAPLALHFPQTGRGDRQVLVHHYEDGELMGTDIETLKDGGALIIDTAGGSKLTGLVPSISKWIGLAGLGLCMAVFWVARARRTPTSSLTT